MGIEINENGDNNVSYIKYDLNGTKHHYTGHIAKYIVKQIFLAATDQDTSE